MSVYERVYGAVKFYKLDGTELFDSEDDYGFWTSKDTEPSPDVKWVRVSVPGADGAVDLSRALAGQVTYEQREIELQFVKKCSDHEVADDLLRTMREFLHGARVRIVTVHTRHLDGYYIADCECDGEARLDGTLTIDVVAHADPFIHVGTMTKTLTASSNTTSSPTIVKAASTEMRAGATRLDLFLSYEAGSQTPKDARTGKIWCAKSDNFFDLSYYSVAGYHADGQGTYVYDRNAGMVGQDIRTGAIGTYNYKYLYISALKRTGYIPDYQYCGSFPFISGISGAGVYCYLGVYITGTIDSVSNPSMSLSRYTSVSSTDSHGRPTAGSSSYNSITFASTLTAGTYDDAYIGRFLINSNGACHVLSLQMGGIASSGLNVRFVIQPSSSFPAHWYAPKLSCLSVDFGGTFCRASGAADTCEVSRIGVKTTHNCELTSSGYNGYTNNVPYTTDGSIDGWMPSDTRWICASINNSFGEDCAVCAIGVTDYEIKTATATNGTMRSTPSVTSAKGLYLSIPSAGDPVYVPAGTYELSGLTIGAGNFTANYATLGGGNATLTWEGGVL